MEGNERRKKTTWCKGVKNINHVGNIEEQKEKIQKNDETGREKGGWETKRRELKKEIKRERNEDISHQH